MGITNFSEQLIRHALVIQPAANVCELGAQNLVHHPHLSSPYAHALYAALGIHDYKCIDWNGENGALPFDLSKPIIERNVHDLVTDFGTSEHVTDLYECFRNVHNLTRVDGIMIHENPKSGNWPDHGYHYLTEEFYTELADEEGYEILRLGTNAAMDNYTDGWNVHCILRKSCDREFMNKETWNRKLAPHVFAK